jgi:hypothetical protein
MSSLRGVLVGCFLAVLATPIFACSETVESAGSSSQHIEGAFTDLSQAEITIPDDLGHPPTSSDVTVAKGFDGKTPAEVVTIVRGQFQGKIDPSYDAFLRDRLSAVHKQWTLVIANSFAKSFPASTFVQTVAADGAQVFIVGTPRGDIFLVTSSADDGEQWYLAKGNSFEPMAVAAGFKPFTPPIMRAELRLEPEGIRIEYPQWTWAPLEKAGQVIEEPGPGSDAGCEGC